MNRATLGEIADQSGGVIQTGPFGSQIHSYDYVDAGVPVVMPQDIVQNRIDLKKIAYIQPSLANSLKRHYLRSGDIVFPRRGDIGKCAIFEESSRLMFCGTGCLKISIPEKIVYPKWLFYYILQEDVIKNIENNAVGSTMLNLNTGILRAVDIVYPKLSSQKKIASILSNYDDLIQTNQQRITLLEEAAQRLYDEWFVKLRFPNHEQVLVVDGVPEGWERTRLAKIAAINANTIKKDEFDSIRYVDISAVVERQIQSYLETDLSEAAGRAKRKVQHGDVIWSCVRPNRRQYALIWNPFENLIVSTGFCTLSADKVPFSYLYLLASHNDFSDYLENVATGSAYPAVTARNFEQYEVVKPSQRVLDVFDRVCLPLIEQAETLKIMNQKLMQARDDLLPRLMSGRLDTSTLSAVGEE